MGTVRALGMGALPTLIFLSVTVTAAKWSTAGRTRSRRFKWRTRTVAISWRCPSNGVVVVPNPVRAGGLSSLRGRLRDWRRVVNCEGNLLAKERRLIK